MASPFEVLRVERGADDDEVREAYRRRVLEAHPDHGGSAGEFRAVRAAYEELLAGERAAEGVDAGAAVDGTGPEDGADAVETPDPVRVEYLDYEVLVDRGWRLDDGDLFEKAAAADLDPTDHGRIAVEPGETLLEAAENRGFAWPFACRGGACANCAVAVVEGDLSLPGDHILPPELVDRDFRLSCAGAPVTEDAKVVFNVKHLPDLDDLRLPPYPFKQAHGDD